MKITKAVIPAAGLGTRMLPATKAIPKGMITIFDKPALQYIVEEAAASGITDILIIINPTDITIQRHFAASNELINHLIESKKESAVNNLKSISSLANLSFFNQPQPNGLGAAIYLAKSFTGSEPFAVLYSDDIIVGNPPTISQLTAAYEKYNLGIAGIQRVNKDDIHKYSSMKLEKIQDREYRITDMIEKPAYEEIFSDFAILGRCVLPPEIYGILENTTPGFGNELQLTDAMKHLAQTKNMIGIDFIGKRFDAGNKLDLLKCTIEVAKSHAEFGEEFREYLAHIND